MFFVSETRKHTHTVVLKSNTKWRTKRKKRKICEEEKKGLARGGGIKAECIKLMPNSESSIRTVDILNSDH